MNANLKSSMLFNADYIIESKLQPSIKKDIINIINQISSDNIDILLNGEGFYNSNFIDYNTLHNMFNHEKTLTIIILTYNEERCITRCINSILDFSDEIIIVDSNSEDNTIKLIEDFNNDKIKVFTIKWINDFSYARNFALSKAKSDWIFFIDADEYIDLNYDSSLIKKTLTYFSTLLDTQKLIICPSIYDEYNDNLITKVTRIVSNSNNILFYGKVHEELRCINDSIRPLILSVNIKLIHDGYTPEILLTKKKLERNIKILNDMLEDNLTDPRWIYFYCRDSYYLYSNDIDKLSIIKNIIFDYILLNKNYSLEISNLKTNSYTFIMLDLLCKILLNLKEYNEVLKISLIMKKINPNNSNVIYYENLSRLLSLKEQINNLLPTIINYRKKHFDIQENVLSSKGYHIDFLIAIMLYENMDFENSFKYFSFLKNQICDEKLRNIIDFYYSILKKICNM